jgi:hypothetical protein
VRLKWDVVSASNKRKGSKGVVVQVEASALRAAVGFLRRSFQRAGPIPRSYRWLELPACSLSPVAQERLVVKPARRAAVYRTDGMIPRLIWDALVRLISGGVFHCAFFGAFWRL